MISLHFLAAPPPPRRLAGFGYDLRALEEAKTDLATSFASVFAGEGAAEPSFVMLAIGVSLTNPQLDGKISPFRKSPFAHVFSLPRRKAILGKFPILKKLPLKRIRVIKENLKVMQRECRKILQVKKREVLDLMKEEGAESNKGQKDLIALLCEHCHSFFDRSVFYLTASWTYGPPSPPPWVWPPVRANLLPTEKRRLSDDEVIGQMT